MAECNRIGNATLDASQPVASAVVGLADPAGDGEGSLVYIGKGIRPGRRKLG